MAKRYFAGLIAAVVALGISSATAGTLTIKNHGWYMLNTDVMEIGEVYWTGNGVGTGVEIEYPQYLELGQHLTVDSKDKSHVKVRVDNPGYGWHTFEVPKEGHKTLEWHGTMFNIWTKWT